MKRHIKMNARKLIKISAILPNYNDASFLPKALQSLLNQSSPLSEIIIVDDASTDESITIIKQFMQKYNNIHLVQHPENRGVSAALNTGIKHTTGDYLILCAADDWYESHMVASAKQAIQQYPHVGLICGDAIVNRFDMKINFKRTLPYTKKNDFITPLEFQQIAKQRYVGFNSGGGMLMKRSAIIEAGLLYPETRWHSDWLLYFVIAMRYGIYYIDKVFIHINMRQTSYSEGKKTWKLQKHVIVETIHILKHHYPDVWHSFKAAALMPHYSIRYIPLFLGDATIRSYLTKWLIWKCFINNNIIVRIGRLFPYSVILHMRRLLRA